MEEECKYVVTVVYVDDSRVMKDEKGKSVKDEDNQTLPKTTRLQYNDVVEYAVSGQVLLMGFGNGETVGLNSFRSFTANKQKGE